MPSDQERARWLIETGAPVPPLHADDPDFPGKLRVWEAYSGITAELERLEWVWP